MRPALVVSIVLILLLPMLLLAQLSAGFAGETDAFDGQWSGSVTSNIARCKPARVTVTVEGATVTGQAQFANDTQSIHGTVHPDGTFGATIGWQPLTGKFSGDGFRGTFKNGDCEWQMLLQREAR